MADKLTNIGAKLYVSASLPATEDVAGYGALTYTQVKGVASIPEFGAEHEELTFVEVEDGVTRKAHGGVNYGGGMVPFRVIEADAGQGILKAARANQSTISVKVERATGLLEYFLVIVLSNRNSEASAANTYTRSANLSLTSEIVEDTSGL